MAVKTEQKCTCGWMNALSLGKFQRGNRQQLKRTANVGFKAMAVNDVFEILMRQNLPLHYFFSYAPLVIRPHTPRGVHPTLWEPLT